MDTKTPLEVITGKNPVREALRAGLPVEELLFVQDLPDDIQELARQRGIAARKVQRNEMDRLAPRHQNVAARVCQGITWADTAQMLESAGAKGQEPLLVLLDGVQDPRNLGAAIRVADAAGAHGVVIPRHRSAPPTDTVARAAAGATAHVPLARVTNLVQTIKELKTAGLWIAGLEAGHGQSMWEAPLTGPLGIVLGGEDRGLRRLVKEHCDYLVNIPMYGVVGSMNASAALAVVLYEVRRQRHKASR